jgi:competence ComEA-like helix-hairpin-helix protein
MRLGLLTKEERLVFLALSVCLAGGGLFQLIDSLFVLPAALTPTVQQFSVSGGTSDYAQGAGADTTLEGEAYDERGNGTENARRERVSPGASRDGSGAGDGRGTEWTKPLPGTESCDASGRLNLNTATTAELEALPGIGAVLAARIVAHREESSGFHSVDELLAVRGIGEKTLERFREWVCVSHLR